MSGRETALALGAVLALAASGMAACGEADDSQQAGAESEHQRAVDEAQLKFAACMRAQGVDYPDPVPSGPGGAYVHVPPPPGERAAFNRAGDKCVRHLNAAGEVPLSPAEEVELQEAIDRDRQVAECLRERGYDWPDPIPGEGGFYDEEIDAAGIDPEDPSVRSAVDSCEEEVGTVP